MVWLTPSGCIFCPETNPDNCIMIPTSITAPACEALRVRVMMPAKSLPALAGDRFVDVGNIGVGIPRYVIYPAASQSGDSRDEQQ